jgi:hypothetical protein
VVFADQGDRDERGARYQVGEVLLGPFNISNNHVSGFDPFPDGTYYIEYFKPGHTFSKKVRPAIGPGAFIIGPDDTEAHQRGTWLHGYGLENGDPKGRTWDYNTEGCCRTYNNIIKRLKKLWDVNRRRGDKWHNTITVGHIRGGPVTPQDVLPGPGQAHFEP